MIRLFTLTLTLFLNSMAHASTLPESLPKDGWVHAIAMHGEPALNSEATHLPYANSEVYQGGKITQSAVGTFDTLNPYTLKGTSIATPDFVFDRLTVRGWNEPFTLYGFIAAQIWLDDNRKSIIFALNKNAQFNNNNPITARDVKATYELLKKEGRPNMRRTYALVDEVVIYDDHHIGFSFNDKADRETPLVLAMMPVLSADEWKTREFNKTTLDPVISSSAYIFETIDVGRRYVLRKNKDYWAKDHYLRKGLVNPDIWEVKYFRDNGVALEAFKKGDIDFAVENDVAKWARQYESNNFIKKEITHNRPDRVQTIIFNTRRTPLNDVRVRKALRLAFDENHIVNSLGYDVLQPTYSLFPNSDLGRDFTINQTSMRDRLKEANALLNDAGYEVKNGQRAIKFTLILNEARLEKIALSWKRSLAKLGITLNIKTFDVVQFSGALSQFDYDMILHGWYNSLSPGSEQNVYWSCGTANAQGSLNYAGICNDDIDISILKLGNARDRMDLISATQSLDTLLWQEVVGIYLPHRSVDLLAFWPEKVDIGPQNALYGFVLESLAVTP